MSWMRWLTLKSFCYFNPDWKTKLILPSEKCGKRGWRSRELDDQEYTGKDYTSCVYELGVEVDTWQCPIPNLPSAQASDLYEWYLLSTDGGFYSDLDILYIKPLEELYTRVSKADVIFCKAGPDFAIGFLGAASGCVLFRSFYAEALKSIRVENYQSAGTEAVYRAARLWPVNLNRDPRTSDRAIAEFRRVYPSLEIVEVPGATIYPYTWKTADALYDRTCVIGAETIGIHWYGGLKSSQIMNNNLTQSSLCNYHCTFTDYVKLVL